MIKWYWKIYQNNNNFTESLKVIGCNVVTHEILNAMSHFSFVYIRFDDSKWILGSSNSFRQGHWTISNTKRHITDDYEFKGEVGLKEIRQKKLNKINGL